MALLFCSKHSLDIVLTTLQKLIWGVTNASKKNLGDFKIENSLSKVEKCQNILLIIKLENVEKMHWAHVLEAQMAFMRRMALVFCFNTLSRYLTTLQKLIWGVTNASKK